MRKRQIAVAMGLCVTSMLSGAPDAVAQNAVTDWSLKAQTVVTAGRPPASSEYLLALVHAAMYDAAVAVEGKYEPFGVKVRTRHQTSVEAAVAAAAFHVLRNRVPSAEQSLTAEYLAYVAALPNGSPRENGEWIGLQVAARWLELRKDDRFDDVVRYEQPAPGPGIFEPAAPTEPVDVKLARVRPYVMDAADRFRPHGPPRLTSRAYTKAFEEVSELGRGDSSIRTPEQLEIARFWGEHTAVQWNRNLRQLAIQSSLELIDTARLLAMTHVASADAVVGCFDAKYSYLFWRPVHAIQRADTDGNPWTSPDSSWAALLTVNHPEYPSAHACWTAAVTETLASFFGEDKRELTLDSALTGTTREYGKFSEIAREVGDARTFAGIHFRFSTEDGSELGRRVARLVTRRHFRPLRHKDHRD
jgi:hypothetical protein